METRPSWKANCCSSRPTEERALILHNRKIYKRSHRSTAMVPANIETLTQYTIQSYVLHIDPTCLS